MHLIRSCWIHTLLRYPQVSSLLWEVMGTITNPMPFLNWVGSPFSEPRWMKTHFGWVVWVFISNANDDSLGQINKLRPVVVLEY